MTAPAASADTPSARSFSGAGLQSVGQIAIVVILLVATFLWMGPQQFVNALTIGAIYALIALGYTMVYGIIELINFAHGDVFMVGAFVGLVFLTTLGFNGADQRPAPADRGPGRRLRGHRCRPRHRRRRHRAVRLPAAAQRAAPGAADHRDRRLVHPAERRPASALSGSPVQRDSRRSSRPTWSSTIGGAIDPRLSLFIIVVAVVLMVALQLFVGRTRLGRAMRSDGPRPRRRRADGREHQPHDRDHVPHRRRRSRAPPAWSSGLYFGSHFNLGFHAGLKAFTAAVLGGIGNTVGRRARRVHHRLHRGGRRRRRASPLGPRRSCSASSSSCSCSAPPACSASSWENGHERRRGRSPRTARHRPPGPRARLRELARPPPLDRRSSSAWPSSAALLPLIVLFPPFTLAPVARRVDRRLHERGRLRPAGDRA